MPFDFDHVPNRRNPARRNKWNYYPADVLPMWVADMDFRAPAPILRALHKAVNHGVLGYELLPRSLQETVAARMQRLYGWQVVPAAVVATTGIVSAFNAAARAFCSRGRGYVVQTPVYNEFHEVKNNVGIRQYNAPLLEFAKGRILEYAIDWNVFARQVKRAGMFLLCNPHNPLGRVFTRKELSWMARLCIENDVVIVADEIHSELLLGAQKFTPMAKLSKEIARRTITLVAPSKAFNVPGLFCGFAIIPDDELRAKYVRVVEHLRLHVSSMGLFAAQAAFSGECDEWLSELRAYLTGSRDLLVEYVKERMPEVRLTVPQATYLGWLDFTALVEAGQIQESPFEFFMKEAKVALSDGRIFGQDYQNYARLNFGCTRSTLMQALERMRKAIYR
ncbi:MAG: MalY/PatB family protein [Bacteroidota bacterium]